MNNKKIYQIWQIFYPIGIYYVVSSIAYFLLELLFGQKNETYMMRQLLCAAVTIPFIRQFYVQDQKIRDVVYGKQTLHWDKTQWKNSIFTILAAAAGGMAVNNLIAMTPLVRVSEGFVQANKAFFGGAAVFEVLGSCLVIPIAEELLFRGVVYQRCKVLFGVPYAIVLSALIFGAVHVNLVQFLYAALLGGLLAFLYEKTGYLYIPVLGHIAANTVAVLRAETGWLEFSYHPTAAGIAVTAVLLAIAAAAVYVQSQPRSGE